jgi:hypothetical protein
MAVSSTLAYGKPTTNQQQKPDAEHKTSVSTINAGSRSSRADFSSSTNLKKFLIYCCLKQKNGFK